MKKSEIIKSLKLNYSSILSSAAHLAVKGDLHQARRLVSNLQLINEVILFTNIDDEE